MIWAKADQARGSYDAEPSSLINCRNSLINCWAWLLSWNGLGFGVRILSRKGEQVNIQKLTALSWTHMHIVLDGP
jgi:hypothetical protein